MIELLLQAERTLAAGRVDEAERLFGQAAAADPRNSIAVVGLARVALERGDEPGAWRLARRALGIDPENVAAQRLAQRLEEVYAYKGEDIAALAAAIDPATETSGGAEAETGPDATSPGTPPAEPQPGYPASADRPAGRPHRRSIVDRLRRRPPA